MPSKPLKHQGLFLVVFVELIGLFISFLGGHGRIQDFLAIITGWQLAVGLLALLLLWAVKYPGKHYKDATKPSWSIMIRSFLGICVILYVTVGWIIGLFPEIVKLSLRHYGRDTLATIQNVELVRLGPKGAEFEASSGSEADTLNATLAYKGRLSTISLEKDDPAFKQVYGATTQSDGRIPVRYLRWMPAIVLPKSDL